MFGEHPLYGMPAQNRISSMRLLGWIVVGLIGITFIIFAIHNYHTTEINLWPAPITLSLPVFLVVFAAIVIGFVGGALVAWLGGSNARRKTREIRRTARRLQDQADTASRSTAVRAA